MPPEARTPLTSYDFEVERVQSSSQITKNNIMGLTASRKRDKIYFPAAPRIASALSGLMSLIFQSLTLVVVAGLTTCAFADTAPPPPHKVVHHRKKTVTAAHSVAVVKATAVATPTPVTPKKKVWVQTWDEPTYKDSTAFDKVDGEDLIVRKAAVDALGPLNGSVVVSDPSTGRILTIVNQPLALSGGFQPCSTVKVSVALAALHEGLVARTSPIRLNSRGSPDLTDAIAYSNNYYFANLGVKLGYDRMSYYARLYGYGEKAGLNIDGEHPGSFPAAPPKNGGMGMLTSFGEEISQTPLELAGLIGAVANGGTLYWLQYPRSDDEIKNFQPQVKRNLDIAKFVDKIRPGMRGAVDFGTAKRAKQDDVILGKTGTCSEGRTHLGWFGSYSDGGLRKLVVVVMLTGGKPSIGSMASTVAGDVYRELASQNFLKVRAPLTPAAILPPQLLSGHLPN
jgi:penicillin-binding protein 2